MSAFSATVRWSLGQPGLVLGAALILLLAGLWGASRTSIDVLPELTRPTLSIHLEAPSLPVSDAAFRIARPVEAALMGLPDLERVRSVVTAGLVVVYAEFAWNSEVFRNRQLVAERLDAIRGDLPPGIEPRIGPLTSLMGEILLLGLHADGAEDPAGLRTLADWTLRPALLALPGVAQVTVLGGQIHQWEVQPDPQRLPLFGVTVEDLASALAGYGEPRGGGVLPADGRQYLLRAAPVSLDAAELEGVAVGWQDDAPVWLGQVADIVAGSPPALGAAGVNGRPAIVLAVQKRPAADTLAVSDAVEHRLGQLRPGLPAHTRIEVIFRQADYIRTAVGHVGDALWHAALIVVLVLALHLSGAYATAICLVAIPLSLAGTVLVLQALGLTINTLTLGGLAIAIGELVDDAVVGVENIARRLRAASERPLDVVLHATVEVRTGILHATLIVVLGCLPLLALGGVNGRLFSSLAIAYAAAILVSLLVAITVTPVMCALGFAGRNPRLPRERRWIDALRGRYLALLDRALDHRRKVLAGIGVAMALGALIAAWLPQTFLPELHEHTLTVNLVLAPGIDLASSNRIGHAAEHLILSLPETRRVGRRTGRAELDEHAEGVHYSEFDVSLDPAATRTRAALIADLQSRLSVLPGTITISQPVSHRIDHLLSGVRAPLVIKIFGDDPDTLDRLAAAVRRIVENLPGLHESGLEQADRLAERQLHVPALRAASHGISPVQVIDQVTQLVHGRPLAVLQHGSAQHDLVLRWPEAVRDPARWREIPVDTPAGTVPLEWLGDMTTVDAPSRISHENGRPRIALGIFTEAGQDSVRSAHELERRLAALEIPPGHEIVIEGRAVEARRDAWRLILITAAVLLFTALLLHTHLRSIRYVAVVLAGIPMAWLGGVLALAITQTPLSIASLVGFITLAGISSRNSILKISRYIDISSMEPSSPARSVILRGSADRLTPVLMTSSATALSLIPLLIGSGVAGTEILYPVALVICGGLGSALIIDAFATPLLYLDPRKEASSTR